MPEKPIQNGDIELWIISRDDWSLPFGAIPVTCDGADWYACTDVVGFDLDQHEAVNAVLSAAAVRSDAQFLFVPRAGLPAIATKAPGISAKYYVKWKNRSPQRPEMVFGLDDVQEVPEPNAATKEFLNQVAWRARSMSREDVLFVWQCIIEELPRWLVTNKKSISLGYVVLQAVPFRKNWKQILLARFPRIASTLNLPKEKRDAQLALTDVERSIHSTELIAFDPQTKTVGWSIEATETKFWDEFIADHESKLVLRLGPSGYARRWDRLCWTLKVMIYDIFAAFVKKTCVPCGAPVRSGKQGGFCIGAATPVGKVRAVGEGVPEVSVCSVDNSAIPKHFDGEPGYLEETAPILPTVSPVLLAEEDVRTNLRNLSRDANGA